MRPNRVEMAVKMMPTCIPLTARICDAPALEKSFFIFLFSSDLLARHSARHKDDDVLSSFSEIISLVFSLMFLAFSSSMLSWFLMGFGSETEKYPREIQVKKITNPFIYERWGDKYKQINAIISAINIHKTPKLTSNPIDANPIPATRNIKSRKKGN